MSSDPNSSSTTTTGLTLLTNPTAFRFFHNPPREPYYIYQMALWGGSRNPRTQPGKSALRHYITENDLVTTGKVWCHELDFSTCQRSIHNTNFMLQIWDFSIEFDTPYWKSFPPIVKRTQLHLLLFDVMDRDSYDIIKDRWMPKVIECGVESGGIVIMIGNKIDLDQDYQGKGLLTPEQQNHQQRQFSNYHHKALQLNQTLLRQGKTPLPLITATSTSTTTTTTTTTTTSATTSLSSSSSSLSQGLPRAVSRDEAEGLAKEHGISYYEISLLTGEGIDDMLEIELNRGYSLFKPIGDGAAGGGNNIIMEHIDVDVEEKNKVENGWCGIM